MATEVDREAVSRIPTATADEFGPKVSLTRLVRVIEAKLRQALGTVDPDLIEARKIAADLAVTANGSWTVVYPVMGDSVTYTAGEGLVAARDIAAGAHDGSEGVIIALAAIKRGRALAAGAAA